MSGRLLEEEALRIQILSEREDRAQLRSELEPKVAPVDLRTFPWQCKEEYRQPADDPERC
jgi:hypothetical protein